MSWRSAGLPHSGCASQPASPTPVSPSPIQCSAWRKKVPFLVQPQRVSTAALHAPCLSPHLGQHPGHACDGVPHDGAPSALCTVTADLLVVKEGDGPHSMLAQQCIWSRHGVDESLQQQAEQQPPTAIGYDMNECVSKQRQTAADRALTAQRSTCTQQAASQADYQPGYQATLLPHMATAAGCNPSKQALQCRAQITQHAVSPAA